LDKALEMAKEVVRIYEEKKDYKEAYREVEEMYKKSCSLPASKRNNNTKTTDCIISDTENMNNRNLI
jgi:hypothetical protein